MGNCACLADGTEDMKSRGYEGLQDQHRCTIAHLQNEVRLLLEQNEEVKANLVKKEEEIREKLEKMKKQGEQLKSKDEKITDLQDEMKFWENLCGTKDSNHKRELQSINNTCADYKKKWERSCSLLGDVRQGPVACDVTRKPFQVAWKRGPNNHSFVVKKIDTQCESYQQGVRKGDLLQKIIVSGHETGVSDLAAKKVELLIKEIRLPATFVYSRDISAKRSKREMLRAMYSPKVSDEHSDVSSGSEFLY